MRDELWMKHDARSSEDGKMVWFIKRTKMEGYGTFWRIVEKLHYQNDHSIPLSGPEFEGIADDLLLTPEQLSKILEVAIQAGLFLADGGRLWQERLRRDQAERSKTKQLAGRLGGLKSGQVRASKSGKQTPAKGTENTTETKQSEFLLEATKLDKREERDIDIDTSVSISNKAPGVSGSKNGKLEIEFPPRWGEKAKAGFDKWYRYRVEIRKPLKQLSLQQQVNKYAQDPQLFVRLVERAIEEGWQGLNSKIPFEDTRGGSSQRKSQNLVNQEQSMNAVATILEGCGYETGRNGPSPGESDAVDAEFHPVTGNDKSVV